jgi:cobalamin biosynthesis protein CobT
MDISGLLHLERAKRTHATVTYCVRIRDGEKEHVTVKFQQVPLDRSGRPTNPDAPWMTFGRTTKHTRGAPAL